MFRRFVTRRRLVALVLALVALGSFLLTASFAAAQTGTPTTSTNEAPEPTELEEPYQTGTPTTSTNPGTVCAAIGIPPGGPLDDLLTGLVNEGIISEDQANRIRSYILNQAQVRCLQTQILPPADILSTAASKLGLTTSQLLTELRQGKSLAQVASDHNVSRDDLKNALLEAARKNANALVQQGRLTQDQANQAVQAVEKNLDTVLDQTGLKGFGRFQPGFGGGHGWHHAWR